MLIIGAEEGVEIGLHGHAVFLFRIPYCPVIATGARTIENSKTKAHLMHRTAKDIHIRP